jgi:acyl-CoA synthetase (AMP-forming)/AMP-acid ligase II
MSIKTNLTDQRIEKHLTEGSWLNKTYGDFLERRVRAWPNQTAIIDSRKRVTNEELGTIVKRLALSFLEMGIKKEDIVGIMLPNRIEYIASLLALSKIGAVSMPLNYDFRSEDLEPLLAFSEAKAIITVSEFKERRVLSVIEEARPQLKDLKYVIVEGSVVPEDMISFQELINHPIEKEYRNSYLDQFKPHPNDIHLLLLTSGTTTIPKGVLHTYNTWGSGGYRIGMTAALRPDDVCLILYPFFGASGNITMTASLSHGCTLVIMDIFKGDEVLKLIEKEKVTTLWGVSTHLIGILNTPDIDKYDVRSLRLVYSFGAPVSFETAKMVEEKFNCKILMIWGTSECIDHTSTLFTDIPEVLYGTVGRPVPYQEVGVIDQDGREVSAGEAGELVTRGPNNFVGYFKNEELNKRVIDSGGWFHTGDAGIRDEFGNIRIIGRITDMILRGGQNIYPREVEELLFKHPKIKDAAIVAMPDQTHGEKACAYVVLKGGESLSFEEIIAFLKGKIATYKFPERLEIVDKFPMTDAGKIQKVKLREDITRKLKQEGKI